MQITTLCYIEKNGQYLMLHRTKKKNDPNAGKWLGVGGHVEPNETVEACLVREIKEETGLTVTDYRKRGVIYFYNDTCDSEEMHLYTVSAFAGEIRECDEGELKWVDREKIFSLPLWEGDKLFLRRLIDDAPYFTLSLYYHGDELLRSEFSH